VSYRGHRAPRSRMHQTARERSAVGVGIATSHSGMHFCLGFRTRITLCDVTVQPSPVTLLRLVSDSAPSLSYLIQCAGWAVNSGRRKTRNCRCLLGSWDTIVHGADLPKSDPMLRDGTDLGSHHVRTGPMLRVAIASLITDFHAEAGGITASTILNVTHRLITAYPEATRAALLTSPSLSWQCPSHAVKADIEAQYLSLADLREVLVIVDNLRSTLLERIEERSTTSPCGSLGILDGDALENVTGRLSDSPEAPLPVPPRARRVAVRTATRLLMLWLRVLQQGDQGGQRTHKLEE
jgi:hypothetical protein